MTVWMKLLLQRYPNLGGCQSTLLGRHCVYMQIMSVPCLGVNTEDVHFEPQTKDGIQIMWLNYNHWVLVVKYCGKVWYLDSLHHARTIPHAAKPQCKTLFPEQKITTLSIQQQVGGNDCGLFACAFAEAACRIIDAQGNINDLENIQLDQDRMRVHLSGCFSESTVRSFPCKTE